MKDRVLKIGVILLLIFAMTMSNFVFVANELISYALDDISTNNDNVEFSVYFKNSEGEKVSNLDMVTSNMETSLFIELNVKKEGYFNGKMDLENSNFILKESNSQYINKVENNTITFNQINAGTNAEIEVKVEFVKEGSFNIDALNKETTVKLNGIYRDSDQRDKSIEAVRTVALKLVGDVKTEDIVNDLQVITNKVVKVNGEDKRVVQLSLKAGIQNNSYPIKEMNLEVTVPAIGKSSPVVEKSIRLNNMNSWDFKYDGQTTAKINMSNTYGLWESKGTEEIILTYIYDANVEIGETKIQAKENIVLYDETSIDAVPANVTIKNSEEYDSIISIDILNKENSIYKGKLYSGINRPYETQTNIAVNLAGVAQNIDITEKPSMYSNTNVDANVYYAQTKINKQELVDILGQEGQLTISDQDGRLIQEINAQTEADEQGDIVINYQENKTKGIQVTTTEPKKIGIIELKHTKIIEPSDKEIVKASNEILTSLEQKYTESDGIQETTKQQTIELKEPQTQAEIYMNKTSLSTLATNNVEISAILKSNKEENDLYKNPKLQIILPKEVEDIKINSVNKLYADEFQIEPEKIIETENGKIIEIQLMGEQKEYLGEASEGIQVIINADITLNKTVPTKISNIAMKYTNENGTQPEYETSVNFDIVSKYGVLVYTKASAYNEENTVLESTSNENIKGKLDITKGEKTMTIERNVINNYEEAVTDVELIGRIPEVGEEEINGETLKSTFTPTLVGVSINNENAKIYYSQDGQEWLEQVENIAEMKYYKIEVPENTVQPGEILTISAQLKIPENLALDQSTYEVFKVSYQYKEQKNSEDYATYLSTNIDNSKVEPVVDPTGESSSLGSIKVKAISAGKELKDGEEIFEGQTVKEIVTLINDTGKDLNNVKITAKQENGIFYTEKVTQETNTATLELMNVTRIMEDETIQQKEYTIETLKKGEEISFEYQFSVKEKPGEKTKGTVIVEAAGIESETITTLTNPIKDAQLKLNVESGYNEERPIIPGSTLPIILKTKNISEKEMTDVIIELPIPQYTTFDQSYILPEDTFEYMGIQNNVARFKIKSIKVGEEVDITLSLLIDDFTEPERQIEVSYKVNNGNETYYSNNLEKKVLQTAAQISVTQTGSITGDKVKNEEKLVYTAIIKNLNDTEQKMVISDFVPEVAVVNKAYIIINGQQINIEDISNNEISKEVTLEGNQEIQLVIETIIDDTLATTDTFTNVVRVNAYSQYIESNEVTYKLETFRNGNGNGNNSNSNAKNKITGTIWLDSNKNGQKDASEEVVKDVNIKLLNSQTTQEISQTKSDADGEYEFKKVQNGNYIVIIEYNQQIYSLTQYKKAGVSEESNSDVIAKQINGQNVAVTDEIQLEDADIENIDVGLVKNEIFDLKLDKSINKVIIQNASGTKTLQFNKSQLVKAEIEGKYVNGSTVLVEYQMDVTNEGEIPGYVAEITDYLPNGFTFNSEINKSWYTTNGTDLHNISLTNQIIRPGETKSITLTLMKTMTEDNTGTAINTAEITKAINDNLVKDRDSLAGNRSSGEDDMSSAELIISVKTGSIWIISSVISAIIIALVVVVVIVIKKRRDMNE